MSTESQTSVDDLIELARDRRRTSRQVLFGNVVDIFVEEDARLSERERSLIVGILRDLIKEVEVDLRHRLAERLQSSETAPVELITLLANEDIEIAGPILRESPVIRDPDLIDIIKQRGREHWLAITMRRSVSAPVGDALVATGDLDVIESLLGNANADLSRRAMEYLVAESQRVDRFQRPLLLRSDLPTDLAMRMYWWVSAALREHLLRHHSIDVDWLDTAMETSVAEESAAREDGGQALHASAHALVDGLEDVTEINASLLVRLLRSGRIPVFIGALARLVDLPEAVVRRIVLDCDGESLAMVCRACSIDRNDFGTLFMLIRSGLGDDAALPPQRLQRVLALFDETQPHHAARATAVWRRHPEYLDAIDALARDRATGPDRQAAAQRTGAA